MILTGDVNLMNLDRPGGAVRPGRDEFRRRRRVFGNLECLLYDPPAGHSVEQEGFFADPATAARP